MTPPIAVSPSLPLVDLGRQQASIEDAVLAKVRQVITGGRFVLGAEGKAFEQEFAAYLGVGHCIGVASGTDALALILRALGIGSGDEVITAASTFVATAEAIALVGARTALADVTADTDTIDVGQVERRITARTRAVIPVHLYGQPADMAPLLDLARRRGLAVVEDAAQAHGAVVCGQKAGTLGDAAAFSFYPAKNLGAYGDAGAVVTNDDRLAAAVRRLRNHGGLDKYAHELVGQNSRLDELQAGILRVKLPHLDAWNARRRRHARAYDRLLSAIPGVALPHAVSDRTHVYHLYVIRVDPARRDALRAHLWNRGVETGIHYPVPVHLTPAFTHLGHKRGEFPVAEALAGAVLSLPMFPELTEEEITYVAAEIDAFMNGKASGEAGG